MSYPIEHDEPAPASYLEGKPFLAFVEKVFAVIEKGEVNIGQLSRKFQKERADLIDAIQLLEYNGRIQARDTVFRTFYRVKGVDVNKRVERKRTAKEAHNIVYQGAFNIKFKK